MCQLLSVNPEHKLVSRNRIDKKELAMYNSKDEHLTLLSFLEHALDIFNGFSYYHLKSILESKKIKCVNSKVSHHIKN